MAVSVGPDTQGRRTESSDFGTFPVYGTIDASLEPLGDYRYVPPDDLPHTLLDVAGADWTSGPTLRDTARQVVLYFETNGVRLKCDGGTVDVTTNGTPRPTGVDCVYGQSQMYKIIFCNSTAGNSAIVHATFFG